MRLNEELMKKAVNEVVKTEEYLEVAKKLEKSEKIFKSSLCGGKIDIAIPLVALAGMCGLYAIDQNTSSQITHYVTEALALGTIGGAIATKFGIMASNAKKINSCENAIEDMMFKSYTTAEFEADNIESGLIGSIAKTYAGQRFRNLSNDEYSEKYDEFNKSIEIYEMENGKNFDYKDFIEPETKIEIDREVDRDIKENGLDNIEVPNAFEDDNVM